jgi:hypothetical protein
MGPSYSRKVISGWSNYSGTVIRHKMIENEMGYRGSKSKSKKDFVKEQRVDGSWCITPMRLRCTLMGFERNYQIKIPSKQLNRSSFSTLIHNPKPKLNPWFITGFSDAEGCFSISIQPSTRMKTNWRISPSFIIKLHIKDIEILEKIQSTLGVGTIRKTGINMVIYIVESFRDLQVIVDHFDKYPLISAKILDYLIFKDCFEIIKQKEHLTEGGLYKLLSLKSSLNWGLPDKLIKAFPLLRLKKKNVVPVNKPEYIFKGITDPFWVAGFVSGDGSFHVITSTPESHAGDLGKVILRFSINLNIREKDLIKGLVIFFNSYGQQDKLSDSSIVTGLETNVKYKNYSTAEESVSLQFTKISDIVNKIIPFFEEYLIVGIKSLDFSDFHKVADIVNTKQHLTKEGFNKILKIKSSMNKNRPW